MEGGKAYLEEKDLYLYNFDHFSAHYLLIAYLPIHPPSTSITDPFM